MNRIVLLVFTALLASSVGCTQRAAVGCGGTLHETDTGRYCDYGVIAGGFHCPDAFPHLMDIEVPGGLARVCAQHAGALDDPIPEQVCLAVGAEAGCEVRDKPPEEPECGGTLHETVTGGYCVYGVTPGDFNCPEAFPHPMDIEVTGGLARVCAESGDALALPIPEQVCLAVGAEAGCEVNDPTPTPVCCPIWLDAGQLPCHPDLPIGGSAATLDECVSSDWHDGYFQLTVDDNGCLGWVNGAPIPDGPVFSCGVGLPHWSSLPSVPAQDAYCAGAPAPTSEAAVIDAIRPGDGETAQVYRDSRGFPAMHLEVDLAADERGPCHGIEIEVAFADGTRVAVDGEYALDDDPAARTHAITVPFGTQLTNRDGETATVTVTVITTTGDYETVSQTVVLREQPL